MLAATPGLDPDERYEGFLLLWAFMQDIHILRRAYTKDG